MVVFEPVRPRGTWSLLRSEPEDPVLAALDDNALVVMEVQVAVAGQDHMTVGCDL
jgi:hypothetical protein